MKINLKLFATLRQGRFDRETLEFADQSTVGDVVRFLKIPDKEAAIIFINSRHAVPDTELHEGDTLAIFPPVGGG